MPATPLIGTVVPWAPTFSPRNWAFCQGQLLAIAQNTALFSILGTVYGGDGRSTFGLPDLRGRVALHKGSGPGLSSYNLGVRLGQEDVSLGSNTIPSHPHGVSQEKTFQIAATTQSGNQEPPSATNRLSAAKLNTGQIEANVYSNVATNTTLGGLQTSGSLLLNSAGSNAQHQNQQPYLVLNYIIALQGIYPSRN